MPLMTVVTELFNPCDAPRGLISGVRFATEQ